MDTHTISGRALQDLRLAGLYSPIEAAQICGVHVKTWRRYEAGTSRIPWAVYQLFKIIVEGSLPTAAGKAWEGWRWINGRLWDPSDRHWHTPGTIRAWFFVAQQLQTWRAYEHQAEQFAKDQGNVIAFPAKRAHDLSVATWQKLEQEEQSGE